MKRQPRLPFSLPVSCPPAHSAHRAAGVRTPSALLCYLPFSQFIQCFAVNTQGRGWARFKALQSNLDSAAFTIAILFGVDLGDGFLDLLDELAFPVPIAQFQGDVGFLAGPIVRV